MKKFSVLLMILAIVCALFADKIDMAVKGNKKPELFTAER